MCHKSLASCFIKSSSGAFGDHSSYRDTNCSPMGAILNYKLTAKASVAQFDEISDREDKGGFLITNNFALNL